MRWLHPDLPFAPRRAPFFYGWVILAASTLGVLMSIPGQTMGVSVFTDPLMQASGLSRVGLSQAYLVGTLASGFLLPMGGALLDRLGARATAVGASGLLALTLVYLSATDRLAGEVEAALGLRSGAVVWILLVVGFTSLRFSGQGMLTMASRNMLAKWFDRKRGRVSGIAGAIMALGFAGAPLLLSVWIDAAGWRGAWLGMAVVVAGGMGVLGWIFFRDNPEECGLQMDGDAEPPAPDPAARDVPEPREAGVDRAHAIRTLVFWAFTLGLGIQSLVITGITFHIVDLGLSFGMDGTEAVSLFLPMAVVSMTVGFAVGFACDRVRMQYLLMAMMLVQVAGFVGFARLDEPLWRVVGVLGVGAGAGFFGPLSLAALPRFFGRAHLGAISGVQTSCLVWASALGPALLAVSRESIGDYGASLYLLCSLPVSVFMLAWAARKAPACA